MFGCIGLPQSVFPVIHVQKRKLLQYFLEIVVSLPFGLHKGQLPKQYNLKKAL